MYYSNGMLPGIYIEGIYMCCMSITGILTLTNCHVMTLNLNRTPLEPL